MTRSVFEVMRLCECLLDESKRPFKIASWTTALAFPTITRHGGQASAVLSAVLCAEAMLRVLRPAGSWAINLHVHMAGAKTIGPLHICKDNGSSVELCAI